MNKNRLAKQVTVAAGFILLCAASMAADTPASTRGSAQTPRAPSPGAQQKYDALPQDDFSGLNYTDEQKTAIDKIHRDTESKKAIVAKDEKLTADQKDALLLGFTRMEYESTYKVLSPVQQKLVRQRIADRRAANKKAPQKVRQPGAQRTPPAP